MCSADAVGDGVESSVGRSTTRRGVAVFAGGVSRVGDAAAVVDAAVAGAVVDTAVAGIVAVGADGVSVLSTRKYLL
jgi:hypothetical protein